MFLFQSENNVGLNGKENFPFPLHVAGENFSPTLSAEVGFDGYLKWMDGNWEIILGYTREELLATPLIQLIHPEDWAWSIAEWQKLADRVTSISFENRCRCKDGAYKWLSWKATPLAQQNSIQAIARDITVFKQQQTELICENERLYRSIFETAAIGMAIATPGDRKILKSNRVLQEMFGYNEQELQQLSFDELTHSEDLNAERSRFQEMVSGVRNSFQSETRYIRKDGTQIWGRLTASMIPNHRGEPQLALGIVEDVSQRVRMETELRHSLKQLSDIQFALDRAAIVAVTDRQGNITHINDKFCEISQYSRSELLGKNHRILNSGYHPKSFFQQMWATISRGKIWKGEIKNKAKNGSYYWVDTTIVPFLDERGKPYQYLSIRYEITERKQVEEQMRQTQAEKTDLITSLQQKTQHLETTLRELQTAQTQLVQSEKMTSLGMMVAGVAHEINNPVNFIHGNLTHADEYIHQLIEHLQLYRKEISIPPPNIAAHAEENDLDFIIEDLPNLLASMKVGTQRIREIVRSLRNFSRLDESQMKSVDIHEGIDSTLLIVQNRLKAKPNRPEIKLIKDYGDLPPVECYASKLNQVFMNLLVNAIDALEMHKRDFTSPVSHPHSPLPVIRIRSATIDKNTVAISISDNGCGIPPDVKSRLFDPFFTTKPMGKGTGLGLAISHQIIVEKHGGKLHCLSEPEQGTEFVIELPIRQLKVA